MNSSGTSTRSLLPQVLLLIANIAFTCVAWYLAFIEVKWGAGPWAPFYSWKTMAVTGVLCTQFVLFAFWMTLVEFRRSIRWAITLAAVTSLAFALSISHYLTGGVPYTQFFDYRGWEEAALQFAYVLTIGVVVILLLQIGIWPLSKCFGWRVLVSQEAGTRTHARFSLAQLFMWVGLIAALLSVLRTIFDLDPSWVIFTVLWVLLTSVVAIPALLVAARPKFNPYLYVGLIAYVPGISYLESELSALCFSHGIVGGWWPLWFIFPVNLAIAVTVLFNVWLLRSMGTLLDLPLSLRRKSPAPSQARETV